MDTEVQRDDQDLRGHDQKDEIEDSPESRAESIQVVGKDSREWMSGVPPRSTYFGGCHNKK